MSNNDSEKGSAKSTKSTYTYKTKEDRQREIEERINASLPPTDIGQFVGVESRSLDVAKESRKALAIAERVVYGATLKDACLIEGESYYNYRFALKAFRDTQRPASDRTESADVVGTHTWTYALGFTLDRAVALCRIRWQGLAEAGGKGSKVAMWMLERRGGRDYLPPVRREQVTSTNTNTTNTNTTLTLEAKLEATKNTLGFSDEHLAQMGDWLSRATTSAQRGEALPAPPMLLTTEATENEEVKVIDIDTE